jgi:hypothetical protein
MGQRERMGQGSAWGRGSAETPPPVCVGHWRGVGDIRPPPCVYCVGHRGHRSGHRLVLVTGGGGEEGRVCTPWVLGLGREVGDERHRAAALVDVTVVLCPPLALAVVHADAPLVEDVEPVGRRALWRLGGREGLRVGRRVCGCEGVRV